MLIGIVFLGILLFLCILFAVFAGESMMCVDSSSLCPLCFIAFILYFSITDLRFPMSGRRELHTSDRFFTFEEKVKMYKNRGSFFLAAIIPELFLCFYFTEILKCLLAIIVLCLFLGLSIVVGHVSIKNSVKERQRVECEELKKQQRREELGQWK